MRELTQKEMIDKNNKGEPQPIFCYRMNWIKTDIKEDEMEKAMDLINRQGVLIKDLGKEVKELAEAVEKLKEKDKRTFSYIMDQNESMKALGKALEEITESIGDLDI